MEMRWRISWKRASRRHDSTLHQLVALGDQIFPSAAVFESFAYELVRNHRVFERLYKLGRKQTPEVVGALKLTRVLRVRRAVARRPAGRAAAALLEEDL